jgi:undecaprenyl-diphosphatase
MLVVEWRVAHSKQKIYATSLDQLTLLQALGIGCFQCLALWPGFSRSASTIMGGMILGVQRKTAAEYSFVAAVPIIAGAAGYDLIHSLSIFSLKDLPFFLIGSAIAFLSAIIAIRTFIRILGSCTLKPFAIYRLILAVPVYFFLAS